MAAKYTVGVAAFKRAFRDLLASVGPADGTIAWLQKAQQKAIELHNERAFNPDLAFDFDTLIRQVDRTHRSAVGAARFVKRIGQAVEAEERAVRPAQRPVREQPKRIEVKEVVRARSAEAEEFPAFGDAVAGESDRSSPPAAQSSRTTEPEAEATQPRTDLVRLPARFLGDREVTSSKSPARSWVKLAIGAGILFALGFIFSKFFR